MVMFMNIFILFLLCFNFVGLINQILDNRLEVGVSFDKGLQSMGTLALSMMGFYCVGVMLVNENVAQILSAAQKIHLDPLIVFGCLLALNLGGYPIIHGLSFQEEMTLFAGVMMTSTLGTVISFQLSLFFTALKSEDIQPYIGGLIYGIIVLPAVMIILGLYLHISDLFVKVLLLLLISALLIIGLLFVKKQTMKILKIMGQVIRILSLLFLKL